MNLVEYDCAEQFLECLPIWRRLGALGNTCYCRSPRAKTPRPSCTPLRSRFLAARMRKFSPPRQPGKILPRENAPGPRAHCAHAASPKRAPMTNCEASARPRATPRAQTPRQSCAPLWPRPLAKRLRTYRPRGNMAAFSQKYEIRLVLGHIGERRLAEACPMINCGASA